MKTLLIFFGHQNDKQGHLSQIAVDRCKAAAAFAREHPDADILVTAGFGHHTQGAPRAHWQYLRDELVRQGVPASRVTSPFTAANTLDEVFRARMVVMDGSYDNVVGVTSDFHAERVRFLLGRVLRDVEVELLEVPSPASAPDRAAEKLSFDYLRRTWVQPPLYRHGAPFPENAWQSAIADRRQHEARGTTAVAIALGCLLGVLLVYAVADSYAVKLAAIALGVAGLFALLAVARQSDRLARRARMYVRAIEVGFDEPGYTAGADILDLHHDAPPSERAVRMLRYGGTAMLSVLVVDWIMQLLLLP